MVLEAVYPGYTSGRAVNDRIRHCLTEAQVPEETVWKSRLALTPFWTSSETHGGQSVASVDNMLTTRTHYGLLEASANSAGCCQKRPSLGDAYASFTILHPQVPFLERLASYLR